MSEYVTLLGAETVERAAAQMSGAADDMLRAAVNISSALDGFSQRMEDWVRRIEQAAEQAASS